MKKIILPLLIFFVSAGLSLYNISNFPKMVGDEGIYVSQAYWLVQKGQLGPYTYWYDHFPLGWAQIGLWQLIVGTNSFFASSVLTARLFMGLVLAGTSTLVYLLTNYLTKSRVAGAVASLLYITSALTQTFGRMVLLDNLAVFWLLISLYLLVKKPTSLIHTLLSSITLSIAILTKESLLFMIPPYFLLLFHLSKNSSFRHYTRLSAVLTLCFILSFFPLLALLKGELLPYPNQVSLYEAIMFQLKRGSQLAFFLPGSHFRTMLSVWLSIDPILITTGFVGTLLLLFQSQHPLLKFFSFFSLFFLFFLVRGGQIYDFYLIPLLPLLAINTAALLSELGSKLKTFLPLALFSASILLYTISLTTYPWTSQATSPQLLAYTETTKLLSNTSRLISNNYFHLDAYLSGHALDWYSKVESDPAVKKDYLSNPPDIFLLLDETIVREIDNGDLPFLKGIKGKSSVIENYGRELGPGEIETVRPYTNDYLTLYRTNRDNQSSPNAILVPTKVDGSTMPSLIAQNPKAILLTNDHFTGTEDLQNKIKLIKDNLPSTIVVVSQDGEGNNTIPWINTNSRTFFKSKEEAATSTLQKTQALSSLGFTGVITATSQNDDGYLSHILSSAVNGLTQYVLYTGSLPSFPANLIARNTEDLQEIQKNSYPGEIYLLIRE